MEDLEALHRTLHVDRVVVVHPSPYGADNSCTVDAVRKLGHRARGIAVIDDTINDRALANMHASGIRGVRVNLESSARAIPRWRGAALAAAAQRVTHFGWHVQTYTNLGILEALYETILALPTRLVVDHFRPATGRARHHAARAWSNF